MADRYTFVPQTSVNVDGRRRIRSRTACDACRNKKRRCPHNISGARRPSLRLTPPPSTASENPGPPEDTASRHAQNAANASDAPEATASAAEDEASHSQGEVVRTAAHNLSPAGRPAPPRPPTSNSTFAASPATPRFVGDLNPEARLLDDTESPEVAQEIVSNDDLGVWIHHRGCNNCTGSETQRTPSTYGHDSAKFPRLLAPISDLIPIITIEKLSEVFFTKIHPILPILNENEYKQGLSNGTLPAALVHAVCLVAAKDVAAEPYLQLIQAGTGFVPPRQFCSRLYTSLVTALSGRVNLRKLTAIRVMALLSLHQEGCDGAEQSSGFSCQAIHRAQSLAMHLRRPNQDEGFEIARTFWCLWVIDRFSAAMNSRPCIISDTDIAIDLITPEQSGSVAFGILLRIAQALNSVIALYRPSNPDSITGIDENFPSFEQIVEEAPGGWDLEPSIITTLHLFYLSTAVLSHRLKTIHTLPTATPARLRQQLSAMQIIRHLRDPRRLLYLPPFPVTVYAVSLALSVSYQQLRYTRLATEQEEARHDFNAACETLQVLRQKWASADLMASLALKISTELKGVASLDLVRLPNNHRESAYNSPHHDHVQPPMNSIQETDEPAGPDMPTVSDANLARPGWNSNSNTFDVFEGMDDVSWMYLDAGNPVSFDLLPLPDFWLDGAQFPC